MLVISPVRAISNGNRWHPTISHQPLRNNVSSTRRLHTLIFPEEVMGIHSRWMERRGSLWTPVSFLDLPWVTYDSSGLLRASIEHRRQARGHVMLEVF